MQKCNTVTGRSSCLGYVAFRVPRNHVLFHKKAISNGRFNNIHTSQVGVQLNQDVQVSVLGLWSSSVRDSDVLLSEVIFTHVDD